MTLLQSLRA